MSTPSLGPAESPGFLLWRATLRWQREVVAALKPSELTHVQFVLLATVWWLTDHGDPPSQREVAEHAGTDPMMTSQVLRALAARDLVVRTPDEHDARIRRLVITPVGRTLAQSAVADVEAVDARFFGPTPPSSLLTILSRLAAYPAHSDRVS